MSDLGTSESGVTFGPEDLKIITTAYNEVWSEIGAHFDRKNLIAQSARTKLAAAILQAAAKNPTDVEYLKREGLRAMREPTED
jgi:hypothetical protein